jgi:hypothetical protein
MSIDRPPSPDIDTMGSCRHGDAMVPGPIRPARPAHRRGAQRTNSFLKHTEPNQRLASLLPAGAAAPKGHPASPILTSCATRKAAVRESRS